MTERPALARRWRVLLLVAVWALLAVPVSGWWFVHTSRATVLASHDATLRPTYDGWATLHLGPFLPDVRRRTGSPVGADVTLGKTEATSSGELVRRYALIASHPEPQIDKAQHVVLDIAAGSVLRGGLIALVPVAARLLVGRARRAELAARLSRTAVPADGETVAIEVSDRHDNIGMDAVARKIADRAGASAVIDAGDDTSTGSQWETFSLDSLADAFADLDRYAIAGNHDHGAFVSQYLADRGWQHLTGEVQDGPGGSRIMGVDDPRSSGLGTWRDETGLSFGEQRTEIADAACAADRAGDRVDTLVVHDASSGREALARGCVDLVLAGHLHVQVGPDRTVGDNGEVGYRYTNGTTGGAAYAIAIGSKLRREAEVTLVTYADGRPVGLQPVQLRTDGRFVVSPYVALDLG